jgi:hypothetical protein
MFVSIIKDEKPNGGIEALTEHDIINADSISDIDQTVIMQVWFKEQKLPTRLLDTQLPQTT